MVETDRANYSSQLQQHLRSILESKDESKTGTQLRGLLQELVTLRSKAFNEKDETAEDDFCTLVEILTACISSVQQPRHDRLISEIYTVPLWECAKETRWAVLNFMLHLSVVNSTTAEQTLQVLVHGLNLPRKPGSQTVDDISGEEWSPSEEQLAVQNHVVAAIQKILELVPVASRLLPPILARGIPNKVIARPMQCMYLCGLFKIAELPVAAAIREHILASVVQHVISLDVEINWQDIAFSLDEEEEEEEAHGEETRDQEVDIFELEGQHDDVQLDPTKFEDQKLDASERQEGDLAFERVTGRGGFEGEAKDNQPSTSGRPQVDETADKLDSMMTLLFQHLSQRIANGQVVRTWQSLLDIFFTTVLNTHRSKFTQYLLWYLLMQEPEATCKSFLKRLLAVLSDPRQPDINRSASAAYVASFMARASFLPDETLLEALQQLSGWCLQYCTSQAVLDGSTRGITGQQGVSTDATPQGLIHQVFYAACQGLLYVLCYRLEQLMQSAGAQGPGTADAVRTMFKDTIPTLLQSRLAPMSVCLPTVVTEFTRLSSRLELLDCTAMLPGGIEAVRCQRPLEMFFPFDPYLLKRSAVFLELKKTFVRWKGGQSSAAEDANEHGDQMQDSDAADDSSVDSDSESSGLESESEKGAESEHDDDDEDDDQLIEEFQDLTPKDAQVSPKAMGQMIKGKRKQQSPAVAASMSSAGTSSPPCPMSWTPKLPDQLVRHHQALVRPLDVHD